LKSNAVIASVIAAVLSCGALGVAGVSCSSEPGATQPPPGNGAGGLKADGGGGRAAAGGSPGNDNGSDGGNGSGGHAGGPGAVDGGSTAGSGGREGAGATGGANGAGGAATAAGGAGGASTSAAGVSLIPSWPTAAILTGVRDVTAPAVTQVVQLRNDGASPVTVTALALAGTNAAAFRVGGATAPLTVPAGGSVPVTIEVVTSGAALPAAPAQNSGGTLLTATLIATTASGSARATVYGLLLTTATHEVTLGQILTTLGIKLNVGLAQNNANPNTGTVQQLPKIEAGTDEIAAPLFRKSGAGTVSLRAVARFSPKGPMPFGWYPSGNSATRNLVATMASMPDAQTSDKARMVLPPLTGATDFDPGAATFGVWVYTDQLSQKYDTGGVASNGDYDYSEDAPNSPANVHRTKVYPLKDAAGVTVPGSYVLAVEEAGNGDYQDYVFILSNVTPAN
jgi:hypothetical protein